MQKIVFILVTVMLLSCVLASCVYKRKNKTVSPDSKITVSGNTRNIPGHAVIVVDNSGVFYVDGMPAWEEEWVNQTVKVTGDLEIVGAESFAKNEIEKQIKIIRSAVVLLRPDE